MAGNSFGVIFKVTTWGESHGRAIGAMIDGCPPRVPLDESDIQRDLDRRKPGAGIFASPRKEDDTVEILSGTFEGETTGTPISLVIHNKSARSEDYETYRDVFRPGHGDYTYHRKYGIRDHRGGGRASGRETAARVAAGVVARKILQQSGVTIVAYTKALGGIEADCSDIAAAGRNELCCPDGPAARRMLKKLADAKKEGDSLGGIVEILVRGCPPGLGEPVFDKIDADLAKAVMSIGTVKGVEIGAGFNASGMKGSQCNDRLEPEGFAGNNAGGILAGITTGQDIVIKAACKPIASIEIPQQTVDKTGKPTSISIVGRHDVCVIPRIIPVCEAMVAITLVDHLLRQKSLR
jgi:chorismate synthase